MFTDIANALWEVFAAGGKARNELLQAWVDAGGRTALLQGIYDLLDGIWGIIQSAKEGFLNLIPDITVDKLLALSNAMASFGARVKEAFGLLSKTVTVTREIEEEILNVSFSFDEPLKKGLKDDTVKKMQEWLEQAGYSVGRAGVDGIFGPDTEAALKKFQEETGLTVNGIYDEATHFALGKALFGTNTVKYMKNVEETITELTGGGERISRIFAGFGAIADMVLKAGKVIVHIGKSIGKAFGPLIDVVLDIAAAIGDFFVWLDKGEGTALAFTTIAEIADGYIASLAAKIDFFAKILRLTFFGPESVEEVNDTLKKFSNWIEKVKKTLRESRIGKWFAGLSESIPQFLEDIKNKGFVQTIKDWFIKSWEEVKTYFESGQYKKDIADAIAAIKKSFKDLLNSLIESISGGDDDRNGRDYRKRTGKQTFADRFLETFESIVSVFVNLPEKIESTLASIKDSQWWDWITSEYVRIKNSIIYFFMSLFGLVKGGNEKVGNKSGNNLVSRDEDPVPTLLDRLLGMWDSIVLFFTTCRDAVVGAYNLVTSEEWWNSVRERVVATKNAVINFFTSIFSPSKEGNDKVSGGDAGSQVSLIESIKAAVIDIWGALSDFFISIWNGIVSVYNFLTSSETWDTVFDTIRTVFDEILAFLRDVGQLISDFWNDDTVQTMLTLLPYIVGVVSFILILQQIGPIVTAIAGVSTSASNAAKMASKANIAKYDFLKTLAIVAGIIIGIAVVAAAVYYLGSKMSFGQMMQGLLGVVLICGILFGSAAIIMAMVNSSKMSSEVMAKMMTFEVMMYSLVGLIAIMAAIIVLLSFVPPGQFFKGFGYIVAVVALFAGLMILLNKLSATRLNVSGLISLGVFLAIMSGLAIILGFIPFELMWNGVKNLSIIMGLLLIFMIGMSHLVKDSNQNNTLFALKQLGIAIAIIAAIVVVLGIIPQAILKKGLIVVGLIMALLFGFIVGIQLLGKGQEVKVDGILKIVAAIGLIGLIVFLLGLMPKEVLKRGLIAVGVIGAVIIGILTFLWLMKKADFKTKDANVLIVIGSILAVLMGLVALMTLVPQGKLWSSLGVFAIIGVMIMALAAFALVMKKNQVTMKDMGPLIAIAAILAIIMGVFLYMASAISIPQLEAATWAMVAIAGAIVAVTAMVLLASRFGGGTTKMAKGALSIGLSLAVLAAFLVAIVGGLGAIDDLLDGDLLRNIIRGAAILSALKVALEPFITDLDSVVAIAVYLGASTIIGNLGSGGLGMFVGSLAIDAAFAGLVATCTAITVGLSKLDGVTEGDLVDDISNGGRILGALGDALGSFAGGLVGGLVAGTTGGLLEGVRNVGDAMKQLRDGVENLYRDYNQETLAQDIEAAKKIYDDLHNFFAEQAGKRYQKTNKDSFTIYDQAASVAEEINRSIEGFGTAMEKLQEGVDGLSENQNRFEQSVRIAMNQANTLHSFFEQLTAYKVYKKSWNGNYFTAPQQLSEDMERFGKAIQTYVEKVQWLSAAYPTLEDDTTTALSIAGQVSRFFDSIQPGGDGTGKGSKSNGVNEYNAWVDSFLTSFNELGTHVSGWKSRVQGFNDENSTIEGDTTVALSVLGQVAQFMEDVAKMDIPVQEGGGFGLFNGTLGWFTAKKTVLETVLEGTESIGKKIAEVHSVLSPLGLSANNYSFERDIGSVIRILGKVATFTETVDGMEIQTDPVWWENLLGLGEKTGFQQVLDNLGKMNFKGITEGNQQGLMDLANTTIIADVDTAIQVLTKMAELSATIKTLFTDPETGLYLDTSDFSGTEAVYNAFDVFWDYVEAFTDQEYKDVVANVHSLQEDISSLVATFQEDWPTKIDGSLVTAMNTELTNFLGIFSRPDGFANTTFSAVCDNFEIIISSELGDAASKVKTEKYSEFVNVGMYLAMGLAQGIWKNRQQVIDAASKVTKMAIEQSKTDAEVKSPSKVMHEIGAYMTIGLANGISDYGYEACNEASSVIHDVLNTIDSVLDSDMDLTPRITPVLDMSNVTNGVSKMDGLFGSKNIGLDTSTRLAKTMLQTNQNGIIAKPAGNGDVVSAIDALGREVTNLKSSVGNLKVVMDSGALVGQIGSKMDRFLGHRAELERRRG